MKFVVIKLKKALLPICICLFTMFLIVFSNNNLLAAKSALILWATSVVPSLLPFFIATELLNYTKIVPLLGNFFGKFMKPLFNVPGEGAFPFIMGIISGYPMGAKIVSSFKEQRICTKEECERLIAFTNNSGPLFIIGTVGLGLFKDTKTGILLFITHILSCISVAFLFRFWKKSPQNKKFEKGVTPIFPRSSKLVNLSNLGEVLSTAITNSISTLCLIGGFIVLFSVVISILKNSKILILLSYLAYPILNLLRINCNYSLGIISGIIELTNGVSQISQVTSKALSTNIIICAFLLGFGGISVALQILSITSKAKISIKPYLIGKLLQAIFAALYTYLILKLCPILCLDLIV